jgi:hypothetical protein
MILFVEIRHSFEITLAWKDISTQTLYLPLGIVSTQINSYLVIIKRDNIQIFNLSTITILNAAKAPTI